MPRWGEEENSRIYFIMAVYRRHDCGQSFDRRTKSVRIVGLQACGANKTRFKKHLKPLENFCEMRYNI